MKFKEIFKEFYFNELPDKMAGKFELKKGKYKELIIDLLKLSGGDKKKEEIINAIKSYLLELS